MAQTTTSKHFLTSILSPLHSIHPAEAQTAATTNTSPLRQLSETSQQTAKGILLTLHFLFPHELLPALDLVDRHLITHLYTTSPSDTQPTSDVTSESLEKPLIDNKVYYVQSASSSSGGSSNIGDTGFSSAKRGRFRNALSKPGIFYEVRLDSWNCSCPAFAYSSLRLVTRDNATDNQNRDRAQDSAAQDANEERLGWLMGGTATKRNAVMPICKHILAVSLTRAAPDIFGSGIVSREVSKEEMAGWAAGWGEH